MQLTLVLPTSQPEMPANDSILLQLFKPSSIFDNNGNAINLYLQH